MTARERWDETRALELWRERELQFPPRVRRMTPDALDFASGAWDRMRALIEAGWHSGWGSISEGGPHSDGADTVGKAAGTRTRDPLTGALLPSLFIDWGDTKQAQHDGSRQIYGGLGAAQRED